MTSIYTQRPRDVVDLILADEEFMRECVEAATSDEGSDRKAWQRIQSGVYGYCACGNPAASRARQLCDRCERRVRKGKELPPPVKPPPATT